MDNIIIIQLGIAPLCEFDDHDALRGLFYIPRQNRDSSRRACLAWRGVNRWWRDRVNAHQGFWLSFFPNRFAAAPRLYQTVIDEMRTAWLFAAGVRNTQLRDHVKSLRGKVETRTRKRAKLDRELELLAVELYDAERAVNANVASIKQTDAKSRLQLIPLAAAPSTPPKRPRHRIKLRVEEDDLWSDE